MKHRLQTLLKHKLQWLVLLTVLLGVSQGVWGYQVTVTVHRTSGTGELNLWTWQSDDTNVHFTGNSWPGDAISESGGAYTWTFTVPDNKQYKFIVSVGGSPQSGDCGPFSTDIDCNYDGNNTVTINNRWIAGNGSGNGSWCCGVDWNTTACMMDYANSSHSKTFTNLSAGTYQFKVVKFNTWEGAVGYTSGSSDKSVTIPGVTSISNNSGNVQIVTSETLDITVHYDGTDAYISTAVPCSAPATPSTVTLNSLSPAASSGSGTDESPYMVKKSTTYAFSIGATLDSGQDGFVATVNSASSAGGTSATSGTFASVDATSPTNYNTKNAYTIRAWAYEGSTSCQSSSAANSTVYLKTCAAPVGGAAEANGSSGSTTVQSGSTATISLTGFTGTFVRWEYSTDNSTWNTVGGISPTGDDKHFTSSALTQTTYFRAVVQNACGDTENSEAVTVTVATRIYFKSTDNGESGNAWYALYCNYSDGTADTRIRMFSLDAANKIYYADVDNISNLNKFIIDRINPSYSTPDGTNVWSHTDDLANNARGAKNMWILNSDWHWDHGNMAGSWSESTYVESGNEIPSMYIKGPLLTGEWGTYSYSGWTSATKENGVFTYIKRFNANAVGGGDDVCKFSLCLSTAEDTDTKLGKFPAASIAPTNIDASGENFKPHSTVTNGENAILTVTRNGYGVTGFTITYVSCTNPTAEHFTMSATSVTYDGNTHSITITPDEGYGAVSDIKYDGSSSAPSAVGDYTVTADIAASGDWCAVDDLEIGTFSIVKRDQSTLSITTSTADRCTGALPLQLEVSGGSTSGTVTYAETTHTGTVSVTSSGEITASTDASITVTATMAGDDTYNDVVSAPVTFTFTQSHVIWLKGSGANSASATYPWEYMTVEVDRSSGKTTPSDLNVNFISTPDFSGGVAPNHSVTITGDNKYLLKSAKTVNDSHYYTVKAQDASGSACAASDASYNVYINSAPAEMCE